MGKSCFFIGKEAFISKTKIKKDQKPNNKSNKRWFGKQKSKDSVSFPGETASTSPPAPPTPPPTTASQPALVPPSPPPPPPPQPLPPLTSVRPTTGSVKSTEDKNKQMRQSLALPTAMAAEAAEIVAQDAAEVVLLTESTPMAEKSREETAAIKIQTAYRAYMARRALRALRGLSTLKPLVQGQNVEKQSTVTLRSMQTLARVQSHNRDRSTRMSEEHKARHRMTQQKHSEKEPEKTKTSYTGEDWDVRIKSKEQIKASLLHRKEAAVRRERALAYASSHQRTRRGILKLPQETDMTPNNPQWGWRRLERWMAVHPWEAQSKVLNNEADSDGRKSTQIAKPLAQLRKTRPRQKTRKAISHGAVQRVQDDDSRSVQSEGYSQRHSICIGSSSSVKGDESVPNKSLVKSHLGAKTTIKARASLSTSSYSASRKTNKDVPEKKRPVGSMKKRLSFSSSPTTTKQFTELVKDGY